MSVSRYLGLLHRTANYLCSIPRVVRTPQGLDKACLKKPLPDLFAFEMGNICELPPEIRWNTIAGFQVKNLRRAKGSPPAISG